MFGWAITFLIIAIIAAILGFSGVAGISMTAAWWLIVGGVVLFILFALLGRGGTPPGPPVDSF